MKNKGILISTGLWWLDGSYIDGLVQVWHNSSSLSMDKHLCCTNPPTCICRLVSKWVINRVPDMFTGTHQLNIMLLPIDLQIWSYVDVTHYFTFAIVNCVCLQTVYWTLELVMLLKIPLYCYTWIGNGSLGKINICIFVFYGFSQKIIICVFICCVFVFLTGESSVWSNCWDEWIW